MLIFFLGIVFVYNGCFTRAKQTLSDQVNKPLHGPYMKTRNIAILFYLRLKFL